MLRAKYPIDLKKVPAHVAVIMDGNGRWARKRSLPRSEGHRKGADVIEKLTDAAVELGIRYVSIYAFSTENWSRPKSEINGLWKLLEYFFQTRLEVLSKKGVRITHSGSTKRLPQFVRKLISESVENTRKNKTIVLNLCLNYGGRQEIIDAVNEWLPLRKGKEIINESKLRKHFYCPEIPDVDLLIRTSGESRISNFLMWQCAYAEFIFMNVLWPDFTKNNVYQAVFQYQQRQRRFGGL
jgi:undecaprenyl diphosphate synthase